MDSLSRCLLLPVACGIVAVVSNCLAADLVVSSDTTVDAAHPLIINRTRSKSCEE